MSICINRIADTVDVTGKLSRADGVGWSLVSPVFAECVIYVVDGQCVYSAVRQYR